MTFLYIIHVPLKIIPHTLGIPFNFTILIAKCGITPAYAGNTLLVRISLYLTQDHPRLRGEHSFEGADLDGASGSPPPTRGTLPNYPRYRVRDGITPRLRGEHLLSNTYKRIVLGSPPPTRGTLIIIFVGPPAIRITPAYAGNTIHYYFYHLII